MNAIYHIWLTAYADDDANYHDYLVWLAANWLQFSEASGAVHTNPFSTIETYIYEAFRRYLLNKVPSKAETA